MNASSNTTASAAERAQDSINNERLQSSIAALAAFGGRDDGGVSRETLTPIDLAARRHLIDYARSLGCEVAIDDCANLFFRRAGTTDQTPVLTGSHADTQPIGGKLDGAYGVLAGLEVIAALNDAGINTARPIEVVAWTNEEGSRFGPGTMGSSAFVTPSLLSSYRQSVDKDGIVMGDALDAALKEVPDVARRAMAEPMDAYVELHIEQGPVLERANAALGVVTGIQSVRWYRVVCTGMAAHAGTTPMDERSDAMAAAIAIATQLYARADQEAAHNIRLTLGRWNVGPNSINTIPGEVEFTIDVRCVDASVLERFERFLQDVTSQHVWRGNIMFENLFYRAPTQFPQPMLDLIETACTRASEAAQRGAPKRVTSGAFHDAMYMADHCPTGMIFVPSKDGISHNAAEETAPADLYLGVQALAYTMVELANR